MLFGFFFGLLFLDYFNVEHKITFMALVCAGSVIPDIDCRQSRVGRNFRFVSWLANVVFGHRGFMHTVYPPLAVFCAAAVFGQGFLGFGFLIGCLLHLVSDSLTMEGTRMFSPVSSFHVRGWIRTGGVTEYLFLALLLGLVFWKIAGSFFL